MEFRAVVLAAGKGSRMVDLTSQMPKCLLPIGGIPMLWYPLRQLQDAGIEHALVVVSEQMKDHRGQILAIPQQYNLHIKIELYEITSKDDPGTADALRQLAADRLRSCTSDLLVTSCDLVTAAPLTRLLNLHRLEAASLTTLFAAPRPDCAVTGVTAPGPKSKHKPERDLVAMTEPGPRLCLLASEADFEEEVPVRLAMLRRHPRLLVRRDLLDAHLYLLAPGLLEMMCDSRGMTSLKGEVVPHIIRAQFRRPRAADTSGDDDTSRAKNVNDFLRPERFSHLARQFGAPEEARETAACFAQTTNEMTWRANTVPAYLAANRAAVRLWGALSSPPPDRLHPSATIPATRGVQVHTLNPHPLPWNPPSLSITLQKRMLQGFGPSMEPSGEVSIKVHIGEYCVVGASSTLSEKTTVTSTVIGRSCHLGSRIRLTDCVVMDHVTVGDDVTLSNCVLMPYCTVESKVEMKDCLVGVRQVVAAGEKKTREVISQQGSSMEVY